MRFELMTSCMPCKRSSQLSYTPFISKNSSRDNEIPTVTSPLLQAGRSSQLSYTPFYG